jgi:hypothetical protein
MTTLAKRVPSKERAKDTTRETVESLKDTINMLPEEAIEVVEMESFKSSAGLQQRLEYLQREQEGIKEENSEENLKELSAAREALEVWPPSCSCQPASQLLLAPSMHDSIPYICGTIDCRSCARVLSCAHIRGNVKQTSCMDSQEKRQAVADVACVCCTEHANLCNIDSLRLCAC